ncbi:hypothetical protein CKO38_01420 [Rhodospirillum rubrum]|uniref:outer membrane protein assembly factor BamE domain-containing protein n=1 Tax=Rhodospirillum rubrum TaxID=1085 RepID=UPI001904649E|nr:outer membrane protein assembly factor BamE [Rhodospirillum rubrum]MBK1663461.1 hypothetical protein [Rhodospirillum rubrum]MBK1675356.1 hypothetical protein [Rhodospirillum rubrum]
MRSIIVSVAATLALALTLSSCQSASDHAADVRRGQDGDKMTVGKVQREIRVGMTNAQVVEVLGSPNMVTTDENRRETWVYDKVSTETAYSNSTGGVNTLILGGGLLGGGLLGGGGGAGYQSGAGAVSSSQRTLTVIIKFNEAGQVRDFAYRSSSF